MQLAESGFVLFTQQYSQAVAFYEHRLGLAVRERQALLTVFDFGASYLMVETGGFASPVEKDRTQNPTVLRLDVKDFDQSVLALSEQGINVSVGRYDWGRIGAFTDPDGNRIELKDAKFER